MEKGLVHIYSGDGRGKTPAALGRALIAANEGKNVVIVQFLKGRGLSQTEFLKRLEPEIKIFHFEKSEESFENLSEEKRKEEVLNIQNGIHFARKVLSTGECDLLILDEVLGLVENKIISVDELKKLLEMRDSASIIMTGINLSDEVCILGDEVSKIETVKFKVWE